jgi:hypothetical protein
MRYQTRIFYKVQHLILQESSLGYNVLLAE